MEHPLRLVATFKDVVYPYSLEIYKFIRDHKATYLNNFLDMGALTEETINKRKHKNILGYLINPELTNDMKDMELQFLEFQFNHEYVYTFDKLSDIIRKVLLSRSLFENKNFESITILCENNHERKFLKEFKVNKFNPKLEKDYNLLDLNWDIFMTDDKDKVIKILESGKDITKKEFLIPNRPYSKLEPKEELLLIEKGAVITYY